MWFLVWLLLSAHSPKVAPPQYVVRNPPIDRYVETPPIVVTVQVVHK